jgi:glyoxylase-like metal-dependent hydrolase (beta-lactamase superfamily II)
MDGIAHFSRPGFDIWCLSDGAYVFDTDVFPSVEEGVRKARLMAADQVQIDTVFHAYLIKPDTSGYVLFDTGCGTAFGDIAGFLPQRLAALGVAPDQIETLVFSHLHSDHCGGAVADGTPVFTDADVALHADEPMVWDGGDYVANKFLTAYASRISTVEDGQEIVPGIAAWALPGHTSGHMGLRVGEQVVLCADILHSDALQLPDPHVASIYDDDPERARETRLQALAEIADRGLIFSGSHGSHMNKFRKLQRLGAGYEAIEL